MNIEIFAFEKILYILHGQVFIVYFVFFVLVLL